MDASGAVDLSLAVSQLASSPLSYSEQAKLERWGEESWELTPRGWAMLQRCSLAAASVLEARLMHIRKERLLNFELPHDPHVVTLAQLAHLQRTHNGTSGQAFELAIADAVRAGDPEVLVPIQDALRLLGVPVDGPIDYVCLGLEKIGQGDEFWQSMADLLPDRGVLRTGLRGRPPTVQRVLNDLATATWKSMASTDPGSTSEKSPVIDQLGRADALVMSGSYIVAASVKINPRHLHKGGWRRVPLWITTGVTSGAHKEVRARVPMVVASLSTASWFQDFTIALDAVDEALRIIDIPTAHQRVTPLIVESVQVRQRIVVGLIKRRRQSVAEVVQSLRASVHGGASELLDDRLLVLPSRATVETLNLPVLTEAWKDDAELARLLQPHQHLWLPDGRG